MPTKKKSKTRFIGLVGNLNSLIKKCKKKIKTNTQKW